MAIRTAMAKWTGDFRGGRGTMEPGSGTFVAGYCYESIAGDTGGSSPTEMLGTAVAGCLCATLSLVLSAAGHAPTRIRTAARAHMEKVTDGFAVTRIELHTQAEVPGLDAAALQRYVEHTAKTCPIGKAVSSVELVVTSELL